MKEPKQSFDLSSLSADYDIVGEQGSTDDVRRYLATRKGDTAKRRDDQPGVLITVFQTPRGDEANALSHLAADTQLLARLAHRRLIPVVEGRWLDDDHYAVITRRVAEPSLADRLSAGETFTTPRIAAILRDINGLLEWAREQRVVHRAVTPASVFLEPKTDRVRVTFAVEPLRRIRHSAEDDDARTIARLAFAMLTGQPEPQSYDGSALVELRPGLPERLGEATDELLSEKHAGTPSDVAAYIAMIGMADPLAEGESERDRIRAEILEEQRVEREAIATARFNFERMMEQEREKLAHDRAELERAIAEERARMERAATEEREKLQRALEAERAALAAKRAELEKTVAEQQATMERAVAEDRRQLERLRAEIKRAGEQEVEMKRQAALENITDDESVLDSPDFEPAEFVAPELAALEPLEFDDSTPLLSDAPMDFSPPKELDEKLDEVSEYSRPPGPTSKQRWAIASAAILAILLVVSVSAALISRHSSRITSTSAGTIAAPARPPVATRPIVAAPVVVARPADSVAATGGADSTRLAAAAQWMDSLREANPLRRPPPRETPAPVATTSTEATAAPTDQRTTPTRTTRDSIPRRVIQSVTDSIFNFRDVTPRRDTVKRDTLRPIRPS
ncbi:MAG TPA: hypothetical protein VF034_10705 [Gemmatimonadaceae bacterium]